MDGLTLIREARNAGLCVAVDGDRLVIRGPKRAERVARKLIAHKPVVLAVLCQPMAEPPPINAAVSEDATDWREFFEERAAIRQHEAGYSRQVAERLAYGECIEGWWELHRGPHQPDLCAGCGEPLVADALDLPDGARVHWERDREFTCLIAYGFARKRRAVEALAALGLQPPTGWEA